MTADAKRSALGRRLALACASVALVLLLGEGVASLLGGRSAFRGLHAAQADAPWLYALSPGATARADGVLYEINANGFRDVEREVAKPAGAFRIAVLGDSVAFGYGVEQAETFVARLEAELEAEPADGAAEGAPPIEVLSFAVSGYNPYNEAALYRGVVREYAPDLVLVQFCVNDLNDPTLHFGAQTIARLGELPELAFPNPSARRKPARDVSQLALLCERSNLCALLLGGLVVGSRGPQDADDWRTGFEIREGPAFAVEWSWLRARYADLARSVRADGAAFGVLAFPYEAEVEHAGAAREKESATQQLVALARSEGWPAIDLLPPMREAAVARSATNAAEPVRAGGLFLDVWHPTVEGHHVAAAAIARALRCGGLVPQAAPPGC